jgi:hypothetical protein
MLSITNAFLNRITSQFIVCFFHNLVRMSPASPLLCSSLCYLCLTIILLHYGTHGYIFLFIMIQKRIENIFIILIDIAITPSYNCCQYNCCICNYLGGESYVYCSHVNHCALLPHFFRASIGRY